MTVKRLISILERYPENYLVLVEGRDGNYCDIMLPKTFPIRIDPYHDIKKGEYCVSHDDDYTFVALILPRSGRF